MSTSGNKNKGNTVRPLFIYAGITAFCFVFYLVYNHFSHGVHSDYMTYLFVWPLSLGVVQKLIRLAFPGLPGPSENSSDLWNAGLAACIVSSALLGIFEIAGTSSIYPVWMMRAGFIMLAAGAVLYIAGGFRRH